MAHRLKAIQRERRRTGLGDSLAVHRRQSVLRTSKPIARKKYLVCAKGIRIRLDSMIDEVFLRTGTEPTNKKTPSSSAGVEHYMYAMRAQGYINRRERMRLIKGE